MAPRASWLVKRALAAAVGVPGYLDNPLRQSMWRAGHAHPGVWLVLGLVGMLYVDQTPLSDGLKSLVRVTLLVAPILVSLGFFLSVLSPPSAMVPHRSRQPATRSRSGLRDHQHDPEPDGQSQRDGLSARENQLGQQSDE
jgi:hypothetical protein